MPRYGKIQGLKQINDTSLSSTAWKEQASCSSEHTSIFFSTVKSSDTTTALQICKKCPVRADCLLEALQYDYHGVWGGSTYDQRLSITRILLNNSVASLTIDKTTDIVKLIDNLGSSKAAATADLINYKSQFIDTE